MEVTKLRKVTSISVKNTFPKSEVTDINIRTLCQFYHNKLEKVFYTVFSPYIKRVNESNTDIEIKLIRITTLNYSKLVIIQTLTINPPTSAAVFDLCYDEGCLVKAQSYQSQKKNERHIMGRYLHTIFSFRDMSLFCIKIRSSTIIEKGMGSGSHTHFVLKLNKLHYTVCSIVQLKCLSKSISQMKFYQCIFCCNEKY